MRIDKFLKVSRILKRRTVAQEAAKQGKVFINGKEVKPAHQVKVGDVVEIQYATDRLRFRILNVLEVVKKNDAPSLYEIITEWEKMKVSVIICAAGRGERAGFEKNKLLSDGECFEKMEQVPFDVLVEQCLAPTPKEIVCMKLQKSLRQ